MEATRLSARRVVWALPACLGDSALFSLARVRGRHLLHVDAAAHQERLIRQLVSRCAATQFGRRNGFSHIASAREFLAKVPTHTYEQLRPSIEAMLAGQPDVLFPGRPVCFASTSGTLGPPKLVPLTRRLLRAARFSAVDAALLGSLAAGTAAWRRGRTLYVGPRKGRPVSGWMVYSEGTAHAYLLPPLLRRQFIPAYEELPEHDEQHDFTALAEMVADQEVTAVAGSPPEIVAFVQSTGIRLPSVRLVFNCGHFASDSLPIYASAFPNAVVVDVYGTNEGTYGLPHSPGCFVMNASRIFYSFLPLAGGAQAVGIGDAEPGRKYRLCVTTPGGLWNYVTDDVVHLAPLGPPLLRLCGRAGRVLSTAGEAVTEDEVIAAVRSAGLATNRYFVTTEGRRYVLHVDGFCGDSAAVDSRLRQFNPRYDALRREGVLAPMVVRRAEVADPSPRKPIRIVSDEGQVQEPLRRLDERSRPILGVNQGLRSARAMQGRERHERSRRRD